MSLLFIILASIVAVVLFNVAALIFAIVAKLTFLKWCWEKLTAWISNTGNGPTLERSKKLAAERKLVDERAFIGCPLWIGGLYIFIDNQIHREKAKNQA